MRAETVKKSCFLLENKNLVPDYKSLALAKKKHLETIQRNKNLFFKQTNL